jgi:hypothetical protein
MFVAKRVIFVLLSFFLISCSNPSIVRVDSNEIAEANVKVIFVPRFEGNPEFVDESTDMFVSTLQSKSSLKIIQGSSLRREGVDIISGGNIADTEIAIEAAKKSGAQVVVLGKVTSHKTEVSLNGFATIRIVDVRNGNIIANFHRPSGMLFGYSEHQAVLEAVKRVAVDTSNAIK